MAGIKEALRRVAEGKHFGHCVHKGEFEDKGRQLTGGFVRFMIIRLESECEITTIFGYGSDIRISDEIKDGDAIELTILSNHCAEWVTWLPSEEIK